MAGPGAGKTEFLAQRATYLLQTGLCPAPYCILAISFKADAAANLGERVRLRCPPEQASRFVSLTFDAFTKGLVDRFHEALPYPWRPSRPYDIAFFQRRDTDAFLDETRYDAPPEWRADIAALGGADFETKHIGTLRLPGEDFSPSNGVEFAIHRWWTLRLQNASRSRLTFVSLNRLAELILRIQPEVSRALRTTYPFVFIDEFQDTTYAQYDFVHSVFCGGPAVVTAVGDDKQRIMAWAGARLDAFRRYEEDFTAHQFSLIFNHRSSPDLVRLQYVVARAIDADAAEPQSQATGSLSGDAAEVWTFDDESSEAATLANWLAQDMHARGTSPRDYAILVRQQAAQFEEQLAGHFRAEGLELRNESRQVGRTTLQDLLAEDLTRIAIAVLRLACLERSPLDWSFVSQKVLGLRGIDADDDVECQRVERELSEFMARMRTCLKGSSTSDDAAIVSDALFAFLDLGALARAFLEYSGGDRLDIAVEGFKLHLAESANDASDWSDCLNRFEGAQAIPLMTVHKSKGLEFDTIVFVGLDDKTWWSHKAGDTEGLATFFVALSRAKQRVVFTYSRTRGLQKGVADLYDLLADGGVPVVSFISD